MRSRFLLLALFVLEALAHQGIAFATQLYSDAWVEGIARMPIDSESTFDPSQHPCLDVVPNGQSLKITKIFARLGIDRKKVTFISI